MLLSIDDSWFTSLFALLIGVGMSHVSHVRAKLSHPAKPTDKIVASLEALGVRVYGLDASLLNSSNGDTSWDIAGYEQQKREIEDTILLALRSPKVYDDISRGTRRKFESNRPRAILFEGPPGTGKTSCARVIANQAGIPLLHLPVEVLMPKRWYGEGERLLGKVFSLANELPNGAIIFLDEVDSIASARDGRMHETTRRLLSVLLRQIDGFEQDKKVVVIGATNRKEDLDPAFISRFDTIIYFGLPDHQTREEIAAQYTKHLTKSESVELANITEGMSGRNIRDLCQQAERQWASKIIRGKAFEDGERGSLPPLQEYIESTASRKNSDKSIASLESMGVRVYGLDAPLLNSSNSDISWDNIAGYEQQKREIEDTILLALHSPKVYDDIASGTRRKFESNKPRAVLFEGPPGTGKTSCARVIANQAGIPLLHLPLEVLMPTKWYGEGERLLGKVFSIANELPNGAIIFLDEVDSFAGARDGRMHEVTRRLLSVLLRQIDGFEQDKKVVVIGATNRKEDLDPAFISRFDTMIYFGLPDQQTREEIAAQYTKHLTKPELVEFAKTTEGMSGRDIRDLCQQAERQWASKIIRGKAPKDGERGSPPPLQEYIESAASRKKALQSVKEEKRRSP